MGDAKRDSNMVVTLLGVSSADGITPVTIYVDPTTHRMLVSAVPGALDDLTDVVITSVAQGDILYNNGTNWVNLAPGTSGKFLKTQGAAANPTWDTPTAGAAGSDTQVQFNDGGSVLGGDAGFTFNKTTNVATIGGVIISGLTASEILITDASKNIISAPVATYPSLTELSYVKGVTSAIQTQIDGKSPTAGNASLVTVGTITAGVWNGTDVPVSAGGTGLSTISALSIWLANALNTVTEITPGAGNSVRVNGAGTAWEAFTPSASIPTAITVANEATDTTCFPLFVTAATGDLGPKSNAGLAFNSNTGLLTATGFSGPLTGNVTGNASGTAATVTGAAQASITSLGTLTTLTVDDITINGNTISSAGASSFAITPTAGQAILLDGTISIDAGVVTGATSITSTTFVGALTGTASGNLVSGGALGTPSSGTGTNITGIPAANILAGSFGAGAYVISTSLQAATIELGHATDTTLARVSAGVVSIEGSNILTALTGAAIAQTFYIGTTQVAINRASAALTLAGITLTTPDIGTPSAGVATNITGLVPANIVAGTLAARINLGEGADTATIGLEMDASMSADERYSGITVPGTAGATIAFGDICYLDVTATEWLLADASAAATAGDVVLGICVDASTDGNATSMLLLGTVRSAAFPASIALGAPVYVSETAGDITATQPTTTDAVIRRVGFAISAEPNTIFFSPSNDFITHV